MSISNTNTRNSYTGNNATSVYAFTFKILLNTDLVVIKRLISTGQETFLTLTTDYTVSGVGSASGGSITLTAGALSNLYKLVIRRVRPLTQSTDIRNQTAFFASSHEDVFDNLTMLVQQNADDIARTVKMPQSYSSTDFDPTLPTGIIGLANTTVVTDPTGLFFIPGPSTAQLASVATSATAAAASATAAAASAATAQGALANTAANTIKGNNTGSLGPVLDLSPAQITAMLPTLIGDSGTGGTKGLTPAPAAGDAAAAKYLKADGTWGVPAGNGISSLTSDITAAGSGSVPATIAANAVTNAKAAQMAANTIKGNNTGSTANALDLTATQATAILNAMAGDSGSGGVKGLAPAQAAGDAAAGKFLKADGTWSVPPSASGLTVLTGDVTATGPGSAAATIAANAVTNAKAAQMATGTIKGNNTGSTANAIDMTAAQAAAILPALIGDSGSGGTKGLAPAPASGDAAAGKFLKADGTWGVPAGNGISSLTSDITAAGSGSVPATIAANAVTNAKAAQMAANTIKGNNTGSTANAIDMTAAQAAAILPALIGDSGSGGTKGLAPAPAAGDNAAGKFLSAGGAWSVPQSAAAPNRLFNSAFDYWQRGTTVTAANAATAYLADRWYVKNSLGTNGILTFSQVAGVQAGSKFGASVKITTAPTALQTNGCELYQILENQDTLPLLGQAASASAMIKALGNVVTVGVQFCYSIIESKATAFIGSEQSVTVNSSTFSLGSLLNQTLTSATITTAGVVGVRIRVLTVSTGNTYDLNNGFVVEQVTLAVGSTAIPYARMGNSAASELALCERYYEKSYDTNVAPATSTNNSYYSIMAQATFSSFLRWTIPFKVTKRAIPTFTIYSVTGASGNVRLSNSSDTAISGTDGIGMQGGSVYLNRAWTSGDFIWHQWTADADI